MSAAYILDFPVHLAEAQLDKIRAWAEASSYVDAVRLFGSYAKGNAHERIDIDLAVSANAGHYVTRYTGFLSVHVAEALFLCLNLDEAVTLGSSGVRSAH